MAIFELVQEMMFVNTCVNIRDNRLRNEVCRVVMLLGLVRTNVPTGRSLYALREYNNNNDNNDNNNNNNTNNNNNNDNSNNDNNNKNNNNNNDNNNNHNKMILATKNLQGLSIYIPWPFPPVWGVADNTKETNKNNGGFTPFFQQ